MFFRSLFLPTALRTATLIQSARDAMRRGLVTVAHDSGNRYDESHLANLLGRLEARYGDPLAALDYLTPAIGNYRDSGNTTVIRLPRGVLPPC